MFSPRYRLVLIDNHPLFQEALAARIHQTDDLEVICTPGDCESGFQAIVEHHPHAAVVHLDAPRRGALALADELSKRMPSLRLLLIGDEFSDVLLDEALRLNVAGFLLTNEPSAGVIQAIRTVCEGEMALSPAVAERLEFDPASGCYVAKYQHVLSSLTNRQLAVLRQLARGESVKNVAKSLSLSERAIESHKYRIMRRLEIHDRVELARYAIREGLALP